MGSLDRAVSKALAILEQVTAARSPVRLSDVAQSLALQKSTVHRILQSLVELGYVEQEPATGRYRPSLKVWEMGMGVIAEHPVKRAAASFLQELHRSTRETVSLTVLAGDDVLYLDKIVAPRPVRFTTRPGSRVAAPLTAGGQAILAHTPDADAIVRRVAQKLLNTRDFDEGAFLVELQRVRERGYALSSGSPGVMSVAAAIMGRDGVAAGALSVSAPTTRMDDAKQAEIVEAVLHACASMAETVGQI